MTIRDSQMTRKDFLRTLVGAGAGALALAACGGDDGGDDPPPIDAAARSCTDNGTTPTIGSNHGHTITVSKEDVAAGADKTYAIQGSSAHPHSVTITAAMFTMLRNGTNVSVTSSSENGHNHVVTIACA